MGDRREWEDWGVGEGVNWEDWSPPPPERKSEGEVASDGSDDHGQRRKAKKKKHRRERRRSSSSDRHSRERDDHRHSRRSRRKRSKSEDRRSRSRSTDRRRKHRRRRRSRSYDSNSSLSWGEGDYGSRGKESYRQQVPNHTIMVQGLAPHLQEIDIRHDLVNCGVSVKDIRLIRHKDTGSSRGFAFVEFHTVAEASNWMDMKKGVLVLQDQYEAHLMYSLAKGGNIDNGVPRSSSDWYCTNCRGYNFKRREFCYKCDEARPPDQDPIIANEISINPTSTIMLFQLDALTTEEGVLQAFQTNPSLASIPIRSVRIARDSLTNLSKGICYVEANNISDAMRLLSTITREEFEIDERTVQAAYHKIPVAQSAKSNAAAAALAAAQWTNNSVGVKPQPEPSSGGDIEKMAQYSASLYAKTKEEHQSYLEYYRDYFRKQAQQGTADEVATDSRSEYSNTALLTKSKVEVAASGTSTALESRADTSTAKTSHSAPDPSQYQYDKASGYCYDSTTGYYYDANTRYYYDPEHKKFLYWDGQLQSYCPAPDPNESTDAGQNAEKPDSSEKEKIKKKDRGDKVKPAKNVAKEMEKWAKTLNDKKEFARSSFYLESETIPEPVKPTLHSTYVQDTSQPSCSSSVKPFLPLSKEPEFVDTEFRYVSKRPASVAFTGNESPQPDSEFLDEIKIACRLCKRQFSSLDVLMKHAKLSDLHKQNLIKATGMSSDNSARSSGNQNHNNSSYGDRDTGSYRDRETGSFRDRDTSSYRDRDNSAYRDRAKERRLRFGTESEPASNSLKDLYMKVKEDIVTSYVEEPTKDGIKGDNLGNRMLQRMGWQAGQGLGKDNKGIVDPITAERRVGKFGLGLDGADLVVEDTDDRQTKARKLTIARYVRLND